MIILEVTEQLEHLVGLSLEVDLQPPELTLKRRVLHLLFIDSTK